MYDSYLYLKMYSKYIYVNVIDTDLYSNHGFQRTSSAIIWLFPFHILSMSPKFGPQFVHLDLGSILIATAQI